MKFRYASKDMTFDIVTYRARLLSCPTRLEVWQCVAGTAMHPGDVARTLDCAPSTVSYHLGLLTQAGLVRYTQQGRHRWFESTGVRLAVVTEEEIAAGAVE